MSMTIIWTIIIVVSIIVEAATVSLVSIWFAVGGGLALICDLLNFSTTIQVVVFAVSSAAIIGATRPLSKKYLRGQIVRTNLDRNIGKHCLVTERITPDKKGEAKVNGALWSATSLNNEIIEAGEYGEIVSIEGAHVVVRKIN